MILRDSNLGLLLQISANRLLSASDDRSTRAAERVLGRLSSTVGESVALPAARLPVCGRHLEAALSDMAASPSPMPDLAFAFAALEGRLRWQRRNGADPSNGDFFEGHANAMLIGPGGLEQRDDVWVGATLMAPGVAYPDHSHPPEEVYLALTQGHWWNAESDWTEPGPGGTVYNPPGILHAMRAGTSAFLAFWFLPAG